MRTATHGFRRSRGVLAATVAILLSGPVVERSTASAACGDGVIEPGELCDDGNAKNCDGCSTVCAPENAESAANDSIAVATGPLVPNACAFGAIERIGDVDFFSFSIGAPASVRIETFDASGQGSCSTVDTSIALLDAGGNVLAVDDDGGVDSCSRINAIDAAGARDLAPGSYFVRVTEGGGDATTSLYALLVSRTDTDAKCAGQPATLVGTTDDEVLVGTENDDVIRGKGGRDIVRGKKGEDVICGGGGDDHLAGGKGGDLVRGGGGDDRLVGGKGNDTLFDRKGSNTLDGRDGVDRCTGAVGDTIVNCEPPISAPTPTPPPPELDCANAIDDEADGLIDCADPDCEAQVCDDANACTINEVCSGGVCAGAPVDCNDLNDCTADVCLDGTCVYENLPDGVACDDGTVCTENDACTAGQCFGSSVPENCSNAIDDDCDQLVDGDDPECIIP